MAHLSTVGMDAGQVTGLAQPRSRRLDHVDGTRWIIEAVLCGTGVRRDVCMELRVKDVDFDRNQTVVRRGKGQ